MSKRFLVIVFALLGMVLLGIILVQFLWIRSAVKIKEEQFSRSVHEALRDVVDRMETYENYITIANTLINSSGDSLDLLVSNDSEVTANITVNDSGSGYQYVITTNDDKGAKTITWQGEPKVTENVHEDFNYVDVRVDTIGIGNEEHNIVFMTMKGDGEDSIYVIRDHSILRIKQKAEQLEEVFEKIVIEIESRNESIEERIDFELLKKELSASLENQGIGLEYEFAVITQTDSTIIKLQSPEFNRDNFDTKYKINLFPADVFDRSNLLLVSFPGKKSHLYRSLGWLLTGSGLFTLFMIVTFAMTLYLILRQKRISEIKSDFINNMTHEFKTPMATISLAADSISNPKTLQNSNQILYFLGIIKEENKRMNKQVENILQMALMDKRDFELNLELIDIHDLIKNAVSSISLAIEKKNGRITTDLNALNPIVYTDKIHFTNVIYNLLDNALKYSDRDPEITISTENTNLGLTIKIADNGIGMDKTTQQKVFDKFFRLTGGNIHNIKGFGLGLSYVKAILNANNGHIFVKSEIGKGSVFTIFVPFGRN